MYQNNESRIVGAPEGSIALQVVASYAIQLRGLESESEKQRRAMNN